MSIHPARSKPQPTSPNPVARHALTGACIALALSACSDDPAPIPATALDPTAVTIAATVTVPEFSATITQPPHPNDAHEAPHHAAFRAALRDAGLIRVDDTGAIAITDAGLSRVWRVQASEASWVIGAARIDRLRAYALVETHNLDSRVCCGLAYDAGVTSSAITPSPQTITVPGLANNLWNDHNPPAVQRWFNQQGGLQVAPDALADALAQSLQALADAPPVAGMREWEDSLTSTCPNAADIDRHRRDVRRALFSVPAQRVAADDDTLTLDADTTARFLAGAFDASFDQDDRFAVLSPASAPIRALSQAFSLCARAPGVDPHTAAWAQLWAHDVALKWGTVSRARLPPLSDRSPTAVAVRDKYSALRQDLGANGAQRLAAVRALQQSSFTDVATWARWVHWDAAGAATPSALQEYFLTFADDH